MRLLVRCFVAGFLLLVGVPGCGPAVDNTPVSQEELEREAEAARKAEAKEEAAAAREGDE